MKHNASLLSLLLVLAACGGGGGGAPAPAPPPAPPPPPAPSFALPSQGRISADSLVAAGCTGGGPGGTLYVNAEVEPWVAVHPGNPNQLAVGWQQDRWSNGAARATQSAVSSDGGQTWRRVLHPFSRCGGATPGSPGDYERASDPWVDFGPDGTLYAMALAASGTNLQAGSLSAMLATRSRDGGLSWEPVQTLARDVDTLFHDKNALTADRLDARYVYAVWDRLDRAGNGPTLLARSSNGGASWEPARAIYTPSVAGGISQTIGNRVVVLNDGSLLNVFVQIDSVGNSSSNWVGVVRSSDKGLSWSAPVRVAEHRAIGTRDPNSGAAIRDGAILPVIAVAPDNTVWVAWQDARFSNGARDAIALARSADGGLSWSAPQAVNQRADVAAFTPTLWVRADGTLGLLHFDLRDDTADPLTLPTSAWLLTSRDGQTWRETRVVGPFDLAPAPNARGLFLGDYMGLVSRGEQFLPVLALSQNDANNRSDVFALPTLPAGGGASALHFARAAPVLAALDPGLRRAAQQATEQALERRLPGRAARLRR